MIFPCFEAGGVDTEGHYCSSKLNANNNNTILSLKLKGNF